MLISTLSLTQSKVQVQALPRSPLLLYPRQNQYPGYHQFRCSKEISKNFSTALYFIEIHLIEMLEVNFVVYRRVLKRASETIFQRKNHSFKEIYEQPMIAYES